MVLNRTWHNMTNWNYVLPPSRPSISELDRIRTYCKNVDKSKPVAILGSTIEFRDLLAELGFKSIFVFDKNRSFYDNVSNLRAYNNEEVLVEGDWIVSLKKYNEYFELILSDLTMGNVDYIHRSIFYQNISNAMTGNGVFIDKVLIHNSFKSIEYIRRKYELLPINLRTINDFSCEALFCSELISSNEMVNTSLLYEQLKEQLNTEKLHKLIDLSSELITPQNCFWYYGKLWCELKEDYYKPFQKSIVYSNNDISSPYYGQSYQIFNFSEKWRAHE